MDKNDLKDIGIEKVADRKIIFNAIRGMSDLEGGQIQLTKK